MSTTRLAYRVSKSKYPPFDGRGAAAVGGRWTSPGREAVYCSASYAGALLEILVHANLGKLPGPHQCVIVGLPDRVSVETVKADAIPGWDADEPSAGRAFGDRWLAEKRSAVLVVPSVVARPYEQNLVVNPAHPDARRIRVGAPIAVTWDARLIRGTNKRGP